MHFKPLHDWELTPAEAVQLQKELASRVIYDRPLALDDVRLVAGVDVSVKGDQSRAAVTVMTFPGLELIEVVTSDQRTPFPYIPGLLSFREGPVLVAAFRYLHYRPDVFIFDGMGRLHPRRMGIASHLGLWLDIPSIGCGKTRLIGEHGELSPERGASVPVFDHGEMLGVLLRTRTNVKPVYISPGHLIDIDSARALVLACTPRYRLPEPIREAHKAAGAF